MGKRIAMVCTACDGMINIPSPDPKSFDRGVHHTADHGVGHGYEFPEQDSPASIRYCNPSHDGSSENRIGLALVRCHPSSPSNNQPDQYHGHESCDHRTNVILSIVTSSRGIKNSSYSKACAIARIAGPSITTNIAGKTNTTSGGSLN